MSFLTDNSREPNYTESQLKNTYIPIQGRKPRYTNQNSTVGIPNFGMSPWNLVTSVLASLGITTPIQPTLLWQNVLIVTENGDDSTGTRNDLTKPFRTITAAVLAASGTDLVWVQPGNYTENGTIIKPNVSLYCQAGVQVFVNDFTVDTLQLGGRHGIHGEGTFTFTKSVPGPVVPTHNTTYEFVFEAKQVVYQNLRLSFQRYSAIELKFDKIIKGTSSALTLSRSLDNSVANVTIQRVVDSNDPDGYIELKTLGDNSTVNIYIGKAEVNRLHEVTGFIYTSGNVSSTSINLEVDNLEYDGGVTVLESQAPLVANAGCSAKKNFKFNNVTTCGALYRWSLDPTVSNREDGCISFTGRVINIPVGVGSVVNTWLDLRKENQAINFKLNMLDETTNALGNEQALINAVSTTGDQKISGYIKTPRTAVDTNGAVCCGLDVDGNVGLINATFENFTVVMGLGGESFRLNTPLGNDELPVKNVYSNVAASADNGGPSFAIDASITTSLNVR